MSSNFGTFRNYARVQDAHDKAFDKAFALRREAERILKAKREAEQPRITSTPRPRLSRKERGL